MIELVDNLSQFLIALIAAIATWLIFFKNRQQTYLLLAGFFGTFMLGSLYWTLHYYLFKVTPQIFYVSELAWISSYIFLLTLVLSMAGAEERSFYHPLMWAAPLFCIPLIGLFLTHGDILLNLIIGGLTMAIAWFALRGLIFARQQKGTQRDMLYFHTAVLRFIFLEYSLWTASCFWISDTYTNPYFWFDFMLTASIFALLPATKKAVGV